ncbi:MAG: hypothetical protein KIH63_002280, partial [Candidatus Saccharibacteria bacterium]|nr:hypothetical protein [Candidatus Saccharibacteria bacterium]
TPVGQVASVTNPRNAVTKYQYDVVGRVTTVTDALQGKASFVYDNVGNVTGVTNANGKTSTRAYDANNRVTRIVDEMSFATDIMYDAVGNVTATKNPRGAITSIEYDAKDNPIKVTDALLNTALFEYDAEDNVTKTTDPNGFATTLEYSPRNLVTKVIEAGNQITTRTYDANRNVLSVTNANGNTTTYTYNPRNLLVKLENPLQKMQMQYDGLGQMTRRINGNGVTTRRDFDALGRLTGVVENEKAGVVADSQTNVTTLYRYDAVSNLVKIIDARNKETSFVYDLLNRQTKETNSLGNSWEYGFDAIGNMVTRKDARGNVTQFAYTANNLLAKKSYPNNTSVTFAYDATGNQTSMTDALGTTKNEFDLLNRITSSTNHAGQKVSYTYDKAGNRTSITYPNAKIQKFEFDNTNYVKAMIDGEGNRFDITRNALHSVTKIAYPNQTQASYTFDKAERLTSVSNTKNSGEVIANFVYTLDANDNRTQTVHTQDGKVNTKSYVYDAINRLVKSSDTQGNTTSYVFDATGNRVSMTGNTDPVTQKRVASYSSQATYNNINAITALTTQVSKPGLGTDQLDKVGKSLNAFINGVEAQKGKHIDAALADELLTLAKQIVELLGQGESIDPALIASGIAALKSKVEAGISSGKINNAGTGNSLLVKLKDAENDNAPSNKNFITTTTFEQDANGNRTSQTVDKQKVEYTYGYEDELLQVSNLQVLGNGKFNTKDKTTNTFDGYGRLYKRAFDWNNGGGQGSQTSSTYVYDGLDPIADYLSGTTEQTNYYRVLGKIISVKNSTSDVQYMHHDGLNSVVALSTKTGLVGESNLYGDYGALSESNSKSRNRFTYTGQEYDKNTGLLHFYAREYDPVTGTWLQQDKYRGQLNDPMSLHRYGYVSNNPTNLVDPYGNCPICVGVFIGVGIGIVYGLMNPKVVSAPPSDPVQQEKHQEEINKRKEEIANSTF